MSVFELFGAVAVAILIGGAIGYGFDLILRALFGE